MPDIMNQKKIDDTPESIGQIKNNIGESQYQVTPAPIQRPRWKMRAPRILLPQKRGQLQTYSWVEFQLTVSIRLCRIEIEGPNL